MPKAKKKKAVAKRAVAKKAPVKKSAVKKVAPKKKAPAKKAPAKKAVVKKTAVKKAPLKKATPKKAAPKVAPAKAAAPKAEPKKKWGIEVWPKDAKFGIYLNASENKVVRINSPYWFPPPPAWQFLTPEVNMTLLAIRELAGKQGLVGNPEAVQWTSIPLLD
jgi:hypothetical protein